jgi:hypothetical protein
LVGKKHLTDDLDPPLNSSDSIISADNSMLFEKQLQLEECLLYYNSGVEIDSDDEEINGNKSDEKKNQEI